MAKFTVYFKDKVIQSHLFDSGVIHIGRDETNDISIDNLAIAPAHAVVIIKENSCVIKQLNNEFPLIVNNEKIKETLLQNNDLISLAKHIILFNSEQSNSSFHISNSIESSNKDLEQLKTKLEDKTNTLKGNFQIMDGPHIGRTLALKKSITRFGQKGSDVVIVTKRKDGFYISTLEASSKITVNQSLLADKSIILNNNDIIVIGNLSMQFFLGT